MPRFVFLYHDCPPDYDRPSHWDLMLEAGQSLRTWAISQLPGEWAALRAQTASLYPDCPPVAEGNTVSAEQLADHRLEYLEIEGPLSGDRGQVSRIEFGTYDVEMETSERLQIEMRGSCWQGRVALESSGPNVSIWTLTILTK